MATVLAVCAGGVLIAGLCAPVGVEVASSKPSQRGGGAAAASRPAAGDANDTLASGSGAIAASGPEFLVQLQQLCGMGLRRPLFDPPPEPALQGRNTRPGAGLSVRLIGTADEPGHSMAVFQKADGAIEVCGEGQSFELPGGVLTVVTIEPDKVAVQYAGRRHELVIPPKP